MANESIVEILKREHRKIESLFEQLEKASPQKRLGLVEQLHSELEAHSSAEEAVVYPAAKATDELRELVEHGKEEHDEARAHLAGLRKISPDEEEDFDEVFQDLRDGVEHHIEEEEGELFPQMEEAFPVERLRELAQFYHRAKESFAEAS